ncbi:MAG: hypothetical protein ACREK7_08840 [Gemmatimonadota bacterium]
MRAWLRTILDRLSVGLIPLDGDFGRRAPAGGNHPCRELQADPAATPRPPADEAAWIPRAILYGPPL